MEQIELQALNGFIHCASTLTGRAKGYSTKIICHNFCFFASFHFVVDLFSRGFSFCCCWLLVSFFSRESLPRDLLTVIITVFASMCVRTSFDYLIKVNLMRASASRHGRARHIHSNSNSNSNAAIELHEEFNQQWSNAQLNCWTVWK